MLQFMGSAYWKYSTVYRDRLVYIVSAVVYGHRGTGFSAYYTDTTYRGMGGGGALWEQSSKWSSFPPLPDCC